MPAKMHPSDWDRLFSPNAPRRGGPLRVLGTLLIIGVVLGLLGAGGVYAVRYREQQNASLIATATSVAKTVVPQQTAAAVAAGQETATAAVARTATAVAKAATPTAAPVLGVGAVNRGGNLRGEPRVADGNVLGLIWPGDQIAFLEQRDVDGQLWYRIRITRPAPARGGQGVDEGAEGWASASLLSPVAPAP